MCPFLDQFATHCIFDVNQRNSKQCCMVVLQSFEMKPFSRPRYWLRPCKIVLIDDALQIDCDSIHNFVTFDGCCHLTFPKSFFEYVIKYRFFLGCHASENVPTWRSPIAILYKQRKIYIQKYYIVCIHGFLFYFLRFFHLHSFVITFFILLSLSLKAVIEQTQRTTVRFVQWCCIFSA